MYAALKGDSMHDSARKEKIGQIYNLFKIAERDHNDGMIYLAYLFIKAWNDNSKPDEQITLRLENNDKIYINDEYVTSISRILDIDEEEEEE